MTVNIKKEQELLYKIFDYYSKETYNNYDFEEAEKTQIPESFDKKIQQLIKQRRKPYFYLINTVAKRVACVIVALLIAATCTVLSVDALREGVKNFFVEIYEKFSTACFSTDTDAPDNIEVYYTPSFIPDGYEVSEVRRDNNAYRVMYKNDDGNEIIYKQLTALGRETLINTEDGEMEKYGDGMYVYLKSFQRRKYYWNDGKYIYCVVANDSIPKEELLKIADSIKDDI